MICPQCTKRWQNSAARPIFHSENDFQFALAWQLKCQNWEVRLEYKPRCFPDKVFIDAFARRGSQRVAIELKYKTDLFNAEHEGEAFNLERHGAAPQARYDFCKDISRLEHLIAADRGVEGVAVLLANQRGLWKPPAGDQSWCDEAFRIHHGAMLKRGQLTWRPGSNQLLKGPRIEPIDLKNNYSLGWSNWAENTVLPATGAFRFLLARSINIIARLHGGW